MDNQESRKLIDLCSKKLEKEPNHLKALLLRASSYLKEGKFHNAENDINRLINIDSKNSTAYFLLGTMYEKQSKFEESLKYLSKAIELNPNNVNAYFSRGAVYNELGYFQKAIDDYNTALQKDNIKTGKKNVYKNIGKVLDMYKENENSKQNYDKLILQNKNSNINNVDIDAEINNYVYNQLKNLPRNNSQNDEDKVQEIYNPSDTNQSKKLFKDINNDEQLNSILKHRKDSLQNNPNQNTNLNQNNKYQNKGHISEINNPHSEFPVMVSQEVKDDEEESEEEDDDNNKGGIKISGRRMSQLPMGSSSLPSSNAGRKYEKWEIFHNQGYDARKKENFPLAIEYYTKAIALHPKYFKAYFNRGFAYDKLGQYDNAINDYTKAIELNPNSAYSYYNRAISYDKKGDLKKTLEDFSTAIRLLPSKVDFYLNRAYTNRKLKILLVLLMIIIMLLI